jgi:prepilin-type N-terminal cleavage/methylation domain-containing protein
MNRGFSLIEVLVASAIGLMAGTFLVSILVNETGIFYKQNSIVTTGLSINQLSEKLTQTIKEATAVVVAYPETGQAQHSSSANKAVIKLISYNNQGVLEGVYDYTIVYQDSNKLIKQVILGTGSTRPGGTEVLSTVLDSLTFSYLNNLDQIVPIPQATKIKAVINTKSSTGRINATNSATIITSFKND